DGPGMQALFPAHQVLALPVAVGAAHVGHAVARDLGEDHLDLRRRRVVGVDQQCDALLVIWHCMGSGRGARWRDAGTIAQWMRPPAPGWWSWAAASPACGPRVRSPATGCASPW